MTSHDKTPIILTPNTNSMRTHQEPLKERQLNTTQILSAGTSQLKTPVTHTTRFLARKNVTSSVSSSVGTTSKAISSITTTRPSSSISSTSTSSQQSNNDNLSQSAKNRRLISRLKHTNAGLHANNLQKIVNTLTQELTTPASGQAQLPIQSHSAHMASHINLPVFMNTPKRPQTTASANTAASSTIFNQSSAHKPTAFSAKKPASSSTLSSSAQITKPISSLLFSSAGQQQLTNSVKSLTPSNRTALAFRSSVVPSVAASTTVTGKPTTEEVEVNPIINGVDYSKIIGMKPQLGYSGPGYIISYECEEKYLKGIHVQEGFWRVAALAASKDPSLVNLGPGICLQRIDIESADNKKTPSKNLTRFDFSIKPRFNTVAKSHDIATGGCSSSSLSNSGLNLETSHAAKQHPKIKKTLRWADALDPINENSGTSLGSPALITATSANNSPISNIHEKCGRAVISGSNNNENRKSMRRSFSLGDINDLILSNDIYDDDIYDKDTENMNSKASHIANNDDNETFSLNRLNFDRSIDYAVSSASSPMSQVNAKSSPGSQAQTPSFSFDTSYRKVLHSETGAGQLLQINVKIQPNALFRSGDGELKRFSPSSHLPITKSASSTSPSNYMAAAAALEVDNLSIKLDSTESSKINSTEIYTTAAASSLLKVSQNEEPPSMILGSPSNEAIKNQTITIDPENKVAAASVAVITDKIGELTGQLQTIITKLVNDPDIGPALLELSINKNVRGTQAAKNKFKVAKLKSSSDYLRAFGVLETMEIYLKFIKDNLSFETATTTTII